MSKLGPLLTSKHLSRSNNITRTPVYANMDTGSVGTGLPSAAYKVYNTLITLTVRDGSGLPDLAQTVRRIDFPFNKRDLLGYNSKGDCYLDMGDE
jgi:hypothetical protein